MKVAQTLSLDTKKQSTVANKTKKIKRQLKEGTLKINENPKRKRTNPKQHRGLVYVGHLPHGFYEEEMTKYFKQFGRVTNVKVCRSRKTGNSKGYGYVEFEHSEVAKIAAETMNNYIMFKKRLTATYVPFEKRPKFIFVGKQSMPGNYSRKRAIEKNLNSKNKTINQKTHIEQSKGRLTRLQKRLQKIKSYGIDIDLKPVDVPAALK